MKSSNKSLYLQWFLVTVFVTSVCVTFGLYFARYLSQNEERHHRELLKEGREGRIFGPLKQRIELMQTLISQKKMSPEEAFELVDKAQNAPFPEGVFLLDEQNKIINSHVSQSFNPEQDKDFQDFKLSPTRTFRVFISPHQPPGRFGMKGRKMPKDALFLVILTVGVSVMIGIGLSIMMLTFYLRRKARQVEDIMNKIKSGDLGARFQIDRTDEAGLLMLKFNEMANEIEKLVMNLRNTEESRKKMLQELAHDLRTPVASIKSLQETLFHSGHLLEASQKEQFQNLAMKEVSYFEKLVEDLLFLSGVNDPRYGQTMKQVNLKALLEEEIEFFEAHNIHVHFKQERDLFVLGDEHLLRRLLKNALSNAVRYANKKVQVSLERVNDKIELTVRDDGPGLKAEDLKTFGEKKYSRQIDTTTSEYISIGLGSVIMKKITSLHNGELKISNQSPGAQLVISFPG